MNPACFRNRPTVFSLTPVFAATDAKAACWLKPLINSFRRSHPTVGFVILAAEVDDILRNYSGVDLALLCGNAGCKVGAVLHDLFPQVAQPVCSAAYLAAHGPFHDTASLNRANLLHLYERHWAATAIGWQPLGWEEWFRAQGSRWSKDTTSLSTNKVAPPIDASLAGEGIMPGWHHMTGGYLAAGHLVYAHPATLSAGRGNFLKCQFTTLERPLVARLVEHLLAALIT